MQKFWLLLLATLADISSLQSSTSAVNHQTVGTASKSVADEEAVRTVSMSVKTASISVAEHEHRG